MAILDSLIMVSCMGLSGQQNDACQKALQAGSKQSGVEQSASRYEQNRLQYLQSGAENYLGRDTVSVVGGIGFVTKSIVEKKTAIGMPNLGICDSLKFEFNSNTGKFVFLWRF